ncbi:MAG: response regulator, partial [Alphaproteobacteria bacterium]|nr:response regulator [Alphaproteobacteria bacterium]
PQVRANVVLQLRSLGYAVAEAPDGAAGLAAVEAASPAFDLLLTDVVMPGRMNGKALADEVRRRWPATRVVFMSGYSDNALADDGQLAAGVLLLAKPFRKADLAGIVRQALDATPVQ